MVKKLKTVLNYIKWISILSLLPVILSFGLYLQISDIRKSKNDFNISEGKIDIVGFTDRVHKGNAYRSFSIKTETKVLFVKLKKNGNLFSFFSKDAQVYNRLFANLNENDIVKIYHGPPSDTQNTIDIIQLEKNNNVLIDKLIHDNKLIGQIKFISIILFIYFAFPVVFYILSAIEERKVHGR
ncbi:MAG: hypothetical protein K0M63_05205 [Weeksellaceae bacterium]|nr:hypothetical protein [Weeksellaceae bacterium]